MKMQFAKRLLGAAAALGMAAVAMAAPAFAAEGQGFVVTFRPGEHGAFAQSYLDYIAGTGYTYQISQATGSVAVLVPFSSQVPDAPVQNQIVSADARYFVRDAAPQYDSSYVGNADYVAEYGLYQQGQEYAYTVRYLDEATGAEVAPALRGTASAVTLVFNAPTVANYQVNAPAQQSLTLTAAGPNELAFYYTAQPVTETVTETTEGTTTVQYRDVVVTSTANVASAGGGAAGGGTAGGGTVINPDETPLTDGTSGASGSASSTGDQGETIEDNETPQTAPETQKPGMGASAMIGIGAGLVALALAVGFFLKRKKDSAEEE